VYRDLEDEYMRIVVEMRKCAEGDLDIGPPVRTGWRMEAFQLLKRIGRRFRGPKDPEHSSPLTPQGPK
jgi:hypothetical protein